MRSFQIKCFGRRIVDSHWTPNDMALLCKLYRVYGGCAYFRDQPLVPEHLYILPSGKLSDWRLGENFDHLYLDFCSIPPLMLREPIDIDLKTHPELDALCTAASAICLKHPVHECGEISEGLLTALLGLCERITPLSVLSDARIADAVDYICQHYLDEDADLSLKALADRVHLDKCWFLKRFGAEVGKSPGRYIRELRLSHAAVLLSKGEAVGEVAEKTGFSSSTAFSNAFKRQFGVTPSSLTPARNRSQT